MGRLFGTDGIRGKANSYPITGEVALKLGMTLGHIFKSDARSLHGRKRAIIGKDTRRSCYMIESALQSGLVAMGMDVYLVGPIPTPAIAYLTRSMLCNCGIMITASHNPADDNGIKIFDKNGLKLNNDLIEQIEDIMLNQEVSPSHVRNRHIGEARRIDDARGRYIAYAKGTAPKLDLFDKTIVLDCANGAGYKVAPTIFRELGAEVIVFNDQPDGLNINDACGAINPETLQMSVPMHNADVGIALDGDADRVIFVDDRGDVVNGDQVIGLCAIDLKERQRSLFKDTVVVTEMSNMALANALAERGISLSVTPVGDHNVIQEMIEQGYSFGGEESGHLVFSGHSTTGDGIVSALQVLKIMQDRQKQLSGLLPVFTPYPRKMVNLPVNEKRPIGKMPEVIDVLSSCRRALNGKGRSLVRYSGTEDKLRILVEAESAEETDHWTKEISLAFEKEIGTQ